MRRFKVGDAVIVDGDSSFCSQSDSVVIKVGTRYDDITGVGFPVVTITGGQKFNGNTGLAITSPTAYYITHKNI